MLLQYWRQTVAAAALLCSGLCCAQQQQPAPMPPAEPPLSIGGDQPTLRVNTQEVLVPTLVEKKDGDVVYGLKADDFVVEDNGAPQKLHVQEEMDTAPVALVVALEQGGMSALEFDKFAKLGPLLETFVAQPRSQAALIGFDSAPHLMVDFTHSADDLNDGLKHLQPGDGGVAILDTVSYAVDLLQSMPKDYRRVLLLISEARDHGSRHTKEEGLIRKIGQSDVLVLTVSFSPMAAEFVHDVKDSGENRVLNPVAALVALVNAFRKNVTKEIATMSGGEYTTFFSDRKLQQRVLDAARHARNRYLLTFRPSNPTPGLHTLKVRLAGDYGARIVARSHYWVGDEASAPGGN